MSSAGGSFLSRRLRALQSGALEKGKALEWKSSRWVVDEFFTNLEVELDDQDVTSSISVNDADRLQRMEDFEMRLKSNKHFMVSWMGFNVADDPPVSEVAAFLHDSDKVDELLQSLFHSPSNCLRTNKKIANHVYADDGSVQTLVLFFVEAYIAIAYQDGRKGELNGEIWSPDRLIKSGREFAYQLVKQGLAPEYLPGVEFLHKYASLHNILAKGKEPEKHTSPNDYNAEEEFEQLPGKSKALVMDAECLCWSALRTMIPIAREKCSAVLKKMIRLDPNHYEWHYQIGSYLRLSRRRVDSQSCISLEEETILWETYDKCEYKKSNEDGSDSDLKRKAYAGVLQGLAEKILFRWKSRVHDLPLTFGDLIFQRDIEGVNYIKEGIAKIMANIDDPDPAKCPNYAEAIRCADILSSIFPSQYRDNILAEKCFLHALARAGTYSKAYHKLGVLYARADEVMDMTKALKYLRLCNEVDSTNVPGATDLLKVLMMSPEMHASEISAVISRTMLAAGITARDKCVFFFIDGCLQFFLHNEEAAIEAWFSADKRAANLKPPVESVFSFFTGVKYSKWNWDVLNPKQILDAIDGMLNATSSHNFKEEKIQFLEKSQQMLSTMGRAWTYKRYNRAEGGDAVQRRSRCVSEPQPQAPISDQDSDWRGSCNRVPLGEDSKTSNSAAYMTPHSRHGFTHQADNEYKRQPITNKFYDQPTTGTDWTSKRYYNKGNSVNDVLSSSPPQYHRHQNSYNNNNCKSRRPPSPDSWR